MKTLTNKRIVTKHYTANYKGSAVYGAIARDEREALEMMLEHWNDASDYELECHGVKRNELGYCYAPCVWDESDGVEIYKED